MSHSKARPTRRVWLPAAFFGLFGLVLCARLVQLQVFEHDRYAEEARVGLAGSDTIYAQRGAILDRNGGVLASSVSTWDVYVNVRLWRDEAVAKESSDLLAPYLDTDPVSLRERVSASESAEIPVARDLSFEVGMQILEARLPGVALIANTDRIHPEGDLAASIIGITGLDNTGLAGIESRYNDVLQGQPGRAIYERDTTGDPIPYGQYIATEPRPGDTLVLTIDRYMQHMAEARLKDAVEKHEAKGGSIIVMNPRTGELLALASWPPLRYSTLDLDSADAISLLRNPAVTDMYEPGSVMKVVTAAAAIDGGAVSPGTSYYDAGIADVYGIPIKNWDDRSYGQQTMTGVLQHSINTGAIFMMQALEAKSPGAFQDYLDAFGFKGPTGIDLEGEASGIIRRPTDVDWSPVDLATQSFGQSISVTPIQMITAIAAAINGGNLVQPHLVKARITPDGTRRDVAPRVVGRAISAETSATIRDMLNQVVAGEGVYHPGNPRLYTAGGKSGTANVPVSNGYDDTQIASFIGFAPADVPEILILVKLDENADGMTGTGAAAPVFAAFVDDALRYLNIRPDKGSYVSQQ